MSRTYMDLIFVWLKRKSQRTVKGNVRLIFVKISCLPKNLRISSLRASLKRSYSYAILNILLSKQLNHHSEIVVTKLAERTKVMSLPLRSSLVGVGLDMSSDFSLD